MVMDPRVGSKRIALSKQIQVNKPDRRFREGKRKHASMLVLFST